MIFYWNREEREEKIKKKFKKKNKIEHFDDCVGGRVRNWEPDRDLVDVRVQRGAGRRYRLPKPRHLIKGTCHFS